jgi:hypothetical protein
MDHRNDESGPSELRTEAPLPSSLPIHDAPQQDAATAARSRRSPPQPAEPPINASWHSVHFLFM